MIGRLIDGRYQVRSRIARGGMATVYLATDLRLERRVAIKVMHGHLADDSQFKERFIQEARSAARLAHPNVVNVFDQGQDSDMAYLVMEYLPGITLRDLLQQHGKLTSEQTLDVMEAVLSGLAAAHKAGIVHRDLKPENVLLADDGRIKIGDFGLARAASANTATGAALLGTIAYLSPELVTRGVADARSDIYAVGIMMYEMLAGEQPYKGEQPMQIAYQHANDSVPTPSTKNPKVPAELDELVLWATARDPDQRPRDARVMLDQLLDTERLLQTALPGGATSSQRTMVLPSAPLAGSNDETQVLAAPARHRTGPVVSDSTSALSTIARRRKRRGWALFVTVVVLAALAGATGWYFGAGPGAQAVIPRSIVGKSIEAATAELKALGFEVATKTGLMDSVEVTPGDVAGTKPGIGKPVSKTGVVTLLLSNGPHMYDLPELVGQSATTALAAAKTHWVVKRSPDQFSSTIAKNIVIAATGADGKSLADAKQYGDQQPITFVVSAGPIPKVSGLSVDDAKKKLEDAGLNTGDEITVFSDKIKSGLVVKTQLPSGVKVVSTGGFVDLLISKGQDLVEVPTVVGQTIASAKADLEAAGFVVTVDTNVPSVGWSSTLFPVQSQNPAGNGKAKRGSNITIVARYN
jgi:eukaryotic-like serine/threonine-protein kinase